MPAIQNLASIKFQMRIYSDLSAHEFIKQIEDIRNAPPPEPEVFAEEKNATAVESQNILNM